jgi:uncharacterized membrane protein
LIHFFGMLTGILLFIFSFHFITGGEPNDNILDEDINTHNFLIMIIGAIVLFVGTMLAFLINIIVALVTDKKVD